VKRNQLWARDYFVRGSLPAKKIWAAALYQRRGPWIKPLFDCDGGVAARKTRIGPCLALAVGDPGLRKWLGTSDGILEEEVCFAKSN
jgi:hypothetical protein